MNRPLALRADRLREHENAGIQMRKPSIRAVVISHERGFDMGLESVGTPVLWIGFTLLVLAMLGLDLGVFHRRAHEVRVKEALLWTVVWISVALLFNVGVYFWFGSERALEFLTGYLIEKALSVDNIFVFLVLFSYFAVPPALQHRVLFWGIVGALVMRAVFILLGAALLQSFHWVIYIFGAFLVFTGVKLLLQRGSEVHPERNPLFRQFKRLIPAVGDYQGSSIHGRREREAVRNAAAPGAGCNRSNRYCLRRRFHPGRLRRHARSVHRLHLEHLRDPWLAGAVLRPRGSDGQVPLPQSGLGARVGLCRRQDDADGHLQGADRSLLSHYRIIACGVRRAFAPSPASASAGLACLEPESRSAPQVEETTGRSHERTIAWRSGHRSSTPKVHGSRMLLLVKGVQPRKYVPREIEVRTPTINPSVRSQFTDRQKGLHQ